MGSFEPTNFSWVAEGRLAALAMPREPGHYKYLSEHGVRHLVCLTKHTPPHHGSCPQIKIHQLPVPDFTPPTPEQIDSFLKIVEDANGRGEAVAVHCMLGRGRTGTLLACYLCKAENLGASEAIFKIRQLRPDSIETPQQEQAVVRFCERLQAEKEGKEA